MVRTLVVTNDLPPKPGGIQTFVHEVVRRQDPSSIVVLGPREDGSAAFDALRAMRSIATTAPSSPPRESCGASARSRR